MPLFSEHPVGLLKVLSIFLFAFTCHQNIFPVVNELKNPTQPRINFVIFSAIFTALFIFMIVNITSFVTYGDAVKSNLFLSYPSKFLLVTM